MQKGDILSPYPQNDAMHQVSYLGSLTLNNISRVVDVESKMATNSIQTGDLQQQVDNLDRILAEHHRTDRGGRLLRIAGRVTGKVLSPDNLFLDHTNRDIADSKITQLQSETAEVADKKHSLLTTIRRGFSGLSEPRKSTLNKYLDETASPFLQAIYIESAADEKDEDRSSSWGEWLERKATDEQLTNFLQWHVHTLNSLASNELVNEGVEQERKEYKEAILLGVQGGWLHKDAGHAVIEVDDIDVVIGDTFDTVLDDIAGYAPLGLNTVVIAPGYGQHKDDREHDTRANIKQILKHELNHKVLGRLPNRWLDEAVTEHIAQVMEYGRPDVLKPADRPIRKGVYQEERYLLSDLLTRGNVDIPLSIVTQAYSDPEGIEGKFYAILTQELDLSWGVSDVLGKIQRRMKLHEKKLLSNKTLSINEVTEEATKLVRSELREAYKDRELSEEAQSTAIAS